MSYLLRSLYWCQEGPKDNRGEEVSLIHTIYPHIFQTLNCIWHYRERKRLANGEKAALSASDEKALLASRENGSASCDHEHAEGEVCETCKRAQLLEEEVPPPYVEAAREGSTSVVRA